MKEKATAVRGNPGRKRGLRWTTALLLLAVAWSSACESANPTSMTSPGDVVVHPNFIVTSTNYKYTLDADFDQGTLVNVNHNAPNNNQLQLNTASGTFPFIWIAMSVRCTIAKINTTTGAILGEYRTIADGAFCAQSSRTTVALDGSVWVGHRGVGGVAHVGLVELNQCVDRNGNGSIDTSTGYGDVRPWPGVSPSNVANAQDECILHQVNTDALGFGDSRHMSIDANNKLWVGSFTGVRGFARINGSTGVIEISRTVPCGGYGGLIDGNGVIWSSNQTSTILRWDPNSPDVAGVNPRCLNVPAYGLAIDPNGFVWGVALNFNATWKISPDGNTVLGPFNHGSNNAQGLAVDRNGDVWVSSSLFCGSGCTIGHLRNDGTFVGNVATPTGAGSTGLSVDAAGKVWAANLNSNSATRIDPTQGAIGGGGVPIGAVDLTVTFPAGPGGRPAPSPYNYSDMTGSQLLSSTSPQGSWIVVQDGGAAGAAWGTITWNTEGQGSTPAGTQITVEARAADTQAGLGSQSFIPITNGTPFSLTGRFIEVRTTLKASPSGASPILSDLTIAAVRSGDTTPPLCTLTATGTDGTGKKFIEVTTSDPASGLSSIVVTKATNLNAVVPAFAIGQTTPVVVRATKIVQTQGSTLALRVTDVAGNITNCDPVDVTISRTSGKPETHIFTGLPQAEHWIDVQNESPGLTSIQIKVNGKLFMVAGLKDGEKQTLNVSSAMNAGNGNTISLQAQGKPGGSAWILIRD